MISNFDVKLALTLPSDTFWGNRPKPEERGEQLSRYADLVFEGQKEVMERFSRGWLVVMVNVDNRVREEADLPQYVVNESPVRAYVELVNGNDKQFAELVRRINRQFGEEHAKKFFGATIWRASGDSRDRTRNVPPQEFTEALLWLDDATYNLSPHAE